MSFKIILQTVFIILLFPQESDAWACSCELSSALPPKIIQVQWVSPLAEISNFVTTIDIERNRDVLVAVFKDHRGKISAVAGFFSVLALVFARSVKASNRKHQHLLDKIDYLESKVLKAQMNPHFIFNSLNSIQSLIANDNPTEAMRYVSKFSKLLRGVIENSDKGLITLQNELANLKFYIELESLRLNCELNYAIAIDQALFPENELIPPMIIQPIVENSLWHGLNHKNGRRELRVNVGTDGNFLKVSVVDNGIGRKAAKMNHRISTGIGLSNTQRRISLANESVDKNFLWIEDIVDTNGTALGTKVTFLIKRRA